MSLRVVRTELAVRPVPKVKSRVMMATDYEALLPVVIGEDLSGGIRPLRLTTGDTIAGCLSWW